MTEKNSDYDYGSYHQARTITLGVKNVTFGKETIVYPIYTEVEL